MLERQTMRWVKARAALEAEVLVSDFELATTPIVKLSAALDKKLAGLSSAKRCAALRALIQRYCAMGHPQLKTGSWASKDGSVAGKGGTDANATYLHEMLINAWTTIKSEKLTIDGTPMLPKLYRKLGTLGGKTLQRVANEESSDRTVEEMDAAAAALKAKPRATRAPRANARTSAASRNARSGGASSSEGGMSASSASASGASDYPSEISAAALVDKRIDVCMNIDYTSRAGGQVSKVSWCPGTIMRIQKAAFSGKGKRQKPVPDLLVVSFDDGALMTVQPREDYWNKPKPGGWRWCVEDAEVESDDEDITDYETSDDSDDSDDDGTGDDDDMGIESG